MLVSLSIQNVVLIDRLNIAFESGLCALTGETGAGKSILLDALGLALGGRSESGLVRRGADQAGVTAVFEAGKKHPSHKILEGAGLEFDSTLILRRAIGADGRSKAYINDQPVSVGLLREIGDTLVEIHGQFETQGLLNPATHGQLLDDYAGIGLQCAACWAAWQDCAQALETLRTETEKSRAEEGYLRQAIEDLDALDPKPGEEEQLSGLRERLMHREQVLEGLNAAYEGLSGENDPLAKTWAALERIAGKMGEGAQAIMTALDRAHAEIQEAVAGIHALSADLQESEHDLESIDDRLFALRAQARKHGCDVDALASTRENLAQRLNMIEHGDEALAVKIRETEKARKSFIEAAEQARAARKKAAEKLDRLVGRELPPLKLDKARFVTEVEAVGESEWGPHGMDRVRFLVSTNPGSAPGPINKIASGGEMARFMLALKVVMAEIGSAGSLVFDEVDAGIGGATADAVGERLARLAKTRQVLVVTHSPQVAARASHHYIVKKEGVKEVKTNVVQLESGQARREEIARMLAGATITEEARAAAMKLLESNAA
jgi:DNA repair protein RecN (Recombination protein N)